MKRRIVSVLVCACMVCSLAGQIVLPAKAYGESDWVEASQAPDTAEITNRKWTYTKTTYVDSKETSLSGYEQVGSEWVKSGSGSKHYAAFPSSPSQFDTSHWIYTSFHRSSSPPYTASETATTKRTVNNAWGGYVYWHWMYDCGGGNGTQYRAIYDRKGTGPDTGFAYKYFGAFTSTNGSYSSDKYYCNSISKTNYIIPERYAYSACQGSTRWFRFSYNTSTYTDYYKLFHYKKVEQLESAQEITETGTTSEVISNVKEMVKYKNTFTITYDANGGTDAPAPQTKTFEVPLTITQEKPTRTGYLFLGWSVDNMALAGTYQPGDAFVSNGDYTLYAVWQNATKYTVTYDYTTNGGTSCPAQAASVFQDEEANLEILAEKDGWEFVGWNTDPAATTGLSSHKVTGDVTLYAIFKKTASAGIHRGDQTPEEGENETFYNQAEGVTITLPEIDDFDDWTAYSWVRSSDRQEFQPGDEILLSENEDFYAKYVKTLYLMYDANGGETEPSHEVVQLYYLADGTYEQEPLVLAAPIAREGYSFDKWAYGSPEGERYAAGDTIFLEETVVMYATWTELEMLQPLQLEYIPLLTGVEVVLSSPEGMPIYYTLDGTTPTEEAALYTGPIPLETAGEYTIKALAIQEGYADSPLVIGEISLGAAEAPAADITGGYLRAGEEITLTAGEGTIYYTLDGTEPTLDSAVYEGPIPISEDCTLTAFAVEEGYAPSECVSFQYWMLPVYAVDRHGYAFGNQAGAFGYTDTSPSLRNYCIPYSSVKQIFGDSVKGKSVYTSMTKYAWSGNCCGMASTSALFFHQDTEITAGHFGQAFANDLGITAVAADYNDLVLKTFIEAMQVSQYTVQFDRDYSQNKVSNNKLREGGDLNALYERVSEDLVRNENDIIAVGMPGVGAHALLAYRMEDLSENRSRLYVYDCNDPDDGNRYVELTWDDNGRITGWSYDMGGYGVWGSASTRNAYISYIPFDTVKFIWDNRGSLYDNYLTLTVSSENVAIYDLNNQLVGEFVDGELRTDRADVFAIPNLSLTEEADLSVYLPEDFYIVSNQEGGEFEATMVGESLGATVSTESETVCFAMDESTQLNDISIEQVGADESYTISLDSNYASGSETVFRNVTLSGTGKGDTLQVSINALGNLTASNCTIGSMKVDGKEQIRYDFTAGVVGKGGTLSERGDISVPAGEDKTFQVIPDPGYRIKDVKVDGISIGPVEEYTFEKVGKAHSIYAYFEPLYAIGDVELDGQTLTVTLNNDQRANVCAAVYSMDGKMLEFRMKTIKADAGTVELTLEKELPVRCEIRVFLLSRNDMEPLCDMESLFL